MLELLLSITLVGTITSNKVSFATFQTAEHGDKIENSYDYYEWEEYELPPTETIFVGQCVQGWTLESVEPRAATVSRGKNRYRLWVGDSPEGEAKPAFVRGVKDLERAGDDVVISPALRDEVSGPGLIGVIMDVAATPVPSVGFQLDEITPGSIFDLVGFQNGDIVMAIDGVDLDTPSMAMSALYSVRYSDSFTVKVLTSDGVHTLSVHVH